MIGSQLNVHVCEINVMSNYGLYLPFQQLQTLKPTQKYRSMSITSLPAFAWKKKITTESFNTYGNYPQEKINNVA